MTIKYIGVSFIVTDTATEVGKEIKSLSYAEQFWKDKYFEAMKLLENYMTVDLGEIKNVF